MSNRLFYTPGLVDQIQFQSFKYLDNENHGLPDRAHERVLKEAVEFLNHCLGEKPRLVDNGYDQTDWSKARALHKTGREVIISCPEGYRLRVTGNFDEFVNNLEMNYFSDYCLYFYVKKAV